MRRRLAIVLLASLWGCPTGYAPIHDAIGDGYQDFRLDGNTWDVKFVGNALTDQDTVDHYLLYRCAEITAGEGFDFFAVLDTDSKVSRSYTYHETSTYQPYGGNGYGTVNTEGRVSGHVRYRTVRARIKAFKGPKPENDPGVFDARETLKYVGAQIKR